MKEEVYYKAKRVIDSCDSISQKRDVNDILNNSIRCLKIRCCIKDLVTD